MEEEKAAAYYDELVRKGGNAAKYKQGLGFGIAQTSVPKGEAYGSLSNFVKGSPGRTAVVEKEIRLDGIRDKLKKSEGDHSSRKRSPDRDRKRDDPVEDRDHRGRRRTPELHVEDRKREKSSRRRSLSSDGSDRDRKRRSRSRSRRRSGTSEKDSTSKKREVQQRNSRSPSHGSSGTSSDRTKKRSRRSKRDRSTSPRYDSRSRQRKSGERSSRSRPSRSRSKERTRSGKSRSSSGRDADRRSTYRRDSSYSPQGSYMRGRSRSRSPTSHRSSHRNRDSRNGGRRSETHRTDSSRRRYDDEKRGKRSARDRDQRPEEKPRFVEGKMQQRDYSKLILNFETMTPAEKVKAKMKLQLAETVVKDKVKGMSDEWERFDFNKDAPLDDDAKQDYFGDGTGARDDTVFLKNTGSTFLSSSNQVTREAQVQSVHDNAIFGPPQGLRIRVLQPEIHPVVEKDDHDEDDDDQPMIVEEAKEFRKDNSAKGSSMDTAHPVSSVVSQQVIAMQQAGSWQERARKMREVRAALDT